MKHLAYLLCLLGILMSCNQSPEPTSVPEPVTETVPPPELPKAGEAEENLQTVLVYYRHPHLEALVPLERKIFRLSNPTDQVKQVIEQLTIPPDTEQGMPIWPGSTYVREIFLMGNGTVVVDFHEDFVAGLNAGTSTESFLIYSLVESILENFPKYDKVQLLVQGRAQETLLGHIDTEFPLSRSNHVYIIVPEVWEEDQITEEELSAPDYMGEGLN